MKVSELLENNDWDNSPVTPEQNIKLLVSKIERLQNEYYQIFIILLNMYKSHQIIGCGITNASAVIFKGIYCWFGYMDFPDDLRYIKANSKNPEFKEIQNNLIRLALKWNKLYSVEDNYYVQKSQLLQQIEAGKHVSS